MRQALARHHQKFEHIIKRSAVAHAGLNDGVEVLHICTQHVRFQHTFATFHPLAVTANSIDFTVVADHTERLSQIPGRECIGAETGMNQGNAAGEIRIAQVGIIFTQLQRSEHSLVNHLFSGKADDVETAICCQFRLLNSFFYFFSYNVEFGFQLVLWQVAGNENLLNIGFVGSGNFTQNLAVDRYITYCKQRQSLFFDIIFEYTQAVVRFL